MCHADIVSSEFMTEGFNSIVCDFYSSHNTCTMSAFYCHFLIFMMWLQVLEQLSGQTPVFSKGWWLIFTTFIRLLEIFKLCSYISIISSLIIQPGILFDLLVSGAMKRLLVMSPLEVRRQCNCLRVGWKWRNTSCWGEILVILDVSALAFRSTLIWESSTKLFIHLHFAFKILFNNWWEKS